MNRINFHFLITENLSNKLNNINELNKLSFSAKINFILENIDKIIYQIEKIKINDKSIIERLEDKKNSHVYMTKYLYRKIKRYHGNFNTYSLALLVRTTIKIFLEIVEEFGFKKALKRLKKKKKILKNINAKGSKKFRIVQLINFIGLKQQESLKLELILRKLLL